MQIDELTDHTDQEKGTNEKPNVISQDEEDTQSMNTREKARVGNMTQELILNMMDKFNFKISISQCKSSNRQCPPQFFEILNHVNETTYVVLDT